MVTATATQRTRRAAQERRAVDALKVLSEETRLRVVLTLGKVDELNVGALCGVMGQQQPALSSHLARLRHCGVIEPRRVGKQVHYSLTEFGRTMAALAERAVESVDG